MNSAEATELENRAQRMRQMVRRLDVEILELAYADLGATYTKAGDICLNCKSVTECLRWLDAAETARPSFCPNLELFERFRATE